MSSRHYPADNEWPCVSGHSFLRVAQMSKQLTDMLVGNARNWSRLWRVRRGKVGRIRVRTHSSRLRQGPGCNRKTKTPSTYALHVSLTNATSGSRQAKYSRDTGKHPARQPPASLFLAAAGKCDQRGHCYADQSECARLWHVKSPVGHCRANCCRKHRSKFGGELDG